MRPTTFWIIPPNRTAQNHIHLSRMMVATNHDVPATWQVLRPRARQRSPRASHVDVRRAIRARVVRQPGRASADRNANVLSRLSVRIIRPAAPRCNLRQFAKKFCGMLRRDYLSFLWRLLQWTSYKTQNIGLWDLTSVIPPSAKIMRLTTLSAT